MRRRFRLRIALVSVFLALTFIIHTNSLYLPLLTGSASLLAVTNYSDNTLITPKNISIPIHRYTGSSTPGTIYYPSNYNQVAVSGYPATFHYNCHSYAFYADGKESYIDSSYNNIAWLNSTGAGKFMLHSNCYKTIIGYSAGSSTNVTCETLVSNSYYRNMVHPDDIIVYVSNDSSSEGVLYTHSAVVYNIFGSKIYVQSKWGNDKLYRHEVDKCPYASNSDSNNNPCSAIIILLRPKHNVSSGTLQLNTFSNSVSTYYSNIKYDSNYHYKSCDCGRYSSSSLEAHTFVAVVYNVYRCTKCGFTYYESSISNNNIEND